ncbi:hypothetical protein KC644_03025 [Candidatus Berkelbacteria bacterium]|nr:hypothetical protein [Candidatus Berkelbacteria bacterium]
MSNSNLQPRDNEWLREKLAYIWYKYFSDIDQPNEVVIKFGQKAATRLGSIKRGKKEFQQPDGSKHKRSIITITGHFKDPVIPEQVIEAVIGHELSHYAHGFSSPLFQRFAHPHKGGIVDKEMRTRGMGEILAFQKKWLKNYWPEYIKENHSFKPKVRTKRSVLSWLMKGH